MPELDADVDDDSDAIVGRWLRDISLFLDVMLTVSQITGTSLVVLGGRGARAANNTGRDAGVGKVSIIGRSIRMFFKRSHSMISVILFFFNQ